MNMSEAVLTQNVKLFDPMDTGYVDSREFMVALLLDGGVIKPPNMDELTALIGNIVKGDQENDGNQRMDYNEMTTVEFWFENVSCTYTRARAHSHTQHTHKHAHTHIHTHTHTHAPTAYNSL